MVSPEPIRRTIRFGAFELDLNAGELRKEGRNLKLQGQPLQILTILVQRPGEIVSREELRQALWPADTFVEFDDGLNTAVRKVRQVLGDSTESPRFIETLPRKGYRFVAHVNGSGIQTPAPPPPTRRMSRLVLVGAAVAITGLISAGASVWMRGERMSVPDAEPVPVPLTSYPGYEWAPSFSPDGTRVAFAWARHHQDLADIYVKLIGVDPPVRLTTKSGCDPAWSPDGRFIAFHHPISNDKWGLFLVPAVGGPERQVAEIASTEWARSHYLSWHPGGRWLVAPDRSSSAEPFGLFLISVDTGEKRRLTSPPEGSFGDQDPDMAPDGSAVVFVRVTKDGGSDIFVQELSEGLSSKGEPIRLTYDSNAPTGPVWMPDGHGILFSAGVNRNWTGLWRLPLSRPGWHPGKQQRLSFAGDAVFGTAVSRQGRLAYARLLGGGANIWRLELSAAKRGAEADTPPVRLIASTRLEHLPQYSPDGKRIAFVSDRSGNFEVWVCNSDGSDATQLTSFGGPYVGTNPTWSPDGRQIVFGVGPGSKSGVYVIGSEGGNPRRLTEGNPHSWSRDGKWIYFHSDRRGEDQVWKIPAAGGAEVQVTRIGDGGGIESPDGASLYFEKSDRDATGLWRVPAAGGEETRVLNFGVCDDCVNYKVTSQGIYYCPCVNPSEPDEIRYLSFATGKVKTIWRGSRPREEGSDSLACGLSVSPDERWLLYTRYEPGNGDDLMLVENFR